MKIGSTYSVLSEFFIKAAAAIASAAVAAACACAAVACACAAVACAVTFDQSVLQRFLAKCF